MGAAVSLVGASAFKAAAGSKGPGWVRFPDAPAIYIRNVMFSIS